MKAEHIFRRNRIRTAGRLFIGILFLTIAGGIFAQSGAVDRETLGSLERLRFTEEEVLAISEIQESYFESIRLPGAELEVLRAQISRELLAGEPDLREIERLIRQGLDFEVEIRMSEIRREFAMQDLLGPRRWAQMKQLARQLAQRQVDLAALGERLRSTRPDLLPALRVFQLYNAN
jgi:hypothetical protein